ncbi:MAG: PAS domain S-box protein [Candidatus Thorarchaeota archaeon]
MHEDGESIVSVARDITEKKLAEQSLKESEERYRLVLGSMKDLIFVYDKDDIYNQVYASDERLLIEPKDDILGKHVSERMLPHLLKLHLERSNKVRETGESMAYDYQLELDGKDKWFTATLSLHKDNESIVATIRDITERVTAEQSLKESEEQHRLVIQSMREMIFVHDKNDCYSQFYTSHDSFLVRPRETLLGSHVRERMPPDVLELYLEHSKMVRETGEAQLYDYPLDVDGSVYWFSSTMTLHKDGESIVTVVQEVTDKINAEHSLKESEEQFKALFKGVPVPSYTWKRAGDDFVLADYNDAILERSEGKFVDFIGMKASELHAEEPDLIEMLHATFDEKKSHSREGWITYKTTGNRAYLSSTLVYVPPDLVMIHAEDITDRITAENALKESERLYKEAQSLAHIGHWRFDADANLIFWSDELFSVFELDQEVGPLSFEDFLEHIHPDDRETLKDQFGTGESYRTDYRIVMEDGSIKHIHEEVFIEHADDGAIIKMRGTAQDITKQKQAEISLKQSEEQYRLLYENLSDVLLHTDTKGLITFCNAQATEMFQYTQEEVVGVHFTKLLHPEDHERIIKIFAYSLEFKATRAEGYELRGIRKDGSVFIFHIKSTLLHTDGILLGYRSLIRDITERKQAEITLKQSEERYRSIFNNVLTGLARTRVEDGKILLCNDALARILGYDSPEDVVDEYVTSEHYVNPELRKSVVEDLQKSGDPRSFVAEITKRDGTGIWVEFSSKLNEEDGYFDDVVIDVTERVRAEVELRKSEEKYRTIVQSMSDIIFVHDTNDNYTQVYTSDDGLLQSPIEDIIGSHPSENVSPELFAAYLKVATNVRETGKPEAFEYSILLNGSEKWFTTTLSLHEDGESIISVAREITERKQAEADVDFERERFVSVLDVLDNGIYIVDKNYDIEYVNQVLRHEFGPIEGQKCYAYFHHRKDPCPWCKNEEVLAGKSVRWEWHLETNNRYYELLDTPIKNADGSLSKFEILHDITEHKLTEMALRESEERFIAVVESSFDGIFVHVDDKIVEVNERFADILGVTKDSLIGRNPLDFVSVESREVVVSSIVPGEVSSLLLDLTRNDGSIARIETYGSPCMYNGADARIVAIRDITDIVHAKEDLEKSEGFVRGLFKGIPVATYVWQKVEDDFVLIDYNDEALTLTQGSVKKLVGQRASSIHKDHSKITDHLHRVYDNQTRESIEHSHKFRNTEKLLTLSSIVSFISPDIVLVHTQDITQERAAQKALAETEAQKEAILRVAPVGIGVVKNRILTYVSKSFTDMVGYSEEELIGNSARMLYTNDDEYLRVGAEKYEQIEKYGTGSMDTQFMCKDGNIIDIDLRSTPIDLDDLEKGVTFTALDISTRLRAARAVRENEEKYRLLIDSMEQGILILQGSPPRVVYANTAVEKMAGYSPDELVALDASGFSEIFHPVTPDSSLDVIQKIIDNCATSPEDGVEHNIRHKDGRMLWLLGHPKPILYEGKPACRHIFVDITGRKESERILKRTQTLLNAVMEQSPFPMLLTGIDGTIEIINKASRDQLEDEHRPSFESGKSWKEVERPQRVFDSEGNEMKPSDMPMAHALQGERTVKKEFRIERMDGTTSWEEIDGLPIFDDDGNVIAGLVVFPDITERKRVEDALMQSEEKYRTLIDSMEQGIVILQGSPPRVVFINNAIENITGYTGEEILALSSEEFTTLLYPEFREILPDRIQGILDGTQEDDESAVEAQIITKDGTIKWVLGQGSRKMYNGEPAFHTMVIDITKQKLAEEDLVQTKTLLSAVIEQSPIPMYIVTTDRKFLLMNDVGFKQTEVERESRQELYDAWPAKSGEQVLYDPEGNILEHEDRPLTKAFRGIRTHRQLTKIKRKDGTIRYEEIDGVPIVDPDGKIIAGLTIFPDITDRIVAQEELMKTKTLLSAVIEQSPIPTFLVNADGIIEMLNDPCLKQFRWTHSIDEYIGQPWLKPLIKQEIYDLDDTLITKKDTPLAKAMRGERTRKRIIKVVNEDGTIQYEEADGVPIYDPDGNLLAAYTIFPDITQRKLAEDELLTSEEMFRLVTGSMKEGILVVDQERNVLYTNKVYETMWSIPKDLIDGKDDVKILEYILDQLPDPLNYLEKVGDLYNSHDQSYNTILLKDGRIFDRYSFPIMLENEVKGRAWIFRDISDEVSIDTKIKQEREALSNFAHRMSHELKNTFIAIGGHACLLEDEHSQGSIDAIKALVEKASKLMSRSVLLADAGLIIGDMSEYSLDEIIVDALSEMIIDEIKIEKDALPNVKCDRMKVTQVVRNILQNAIEHGDAKKIEIRVQENTEGRYILIKNDGTPIPDEQHQKIFREGFTTKKGGGIGLGIVRKIVEAHGWTITLDKGEPTCFRIYIPSSRLT